VIRVLGPEGKARSVALGKAPTLSGPGLRQAGDAAGGVERVFDLSVGKYDLSVRAGPSFTTRREEAASQMIEFIQAYPPAAGAIGDILARNLDWPGAEEIEQRLKAQIEGGGVDPEAAAREQMLQAQVAQLSQALAVMEADRSVAREKLSIDAFNAQTQRMKVVKDGRQDLPPPSTSGEGPGIAEISRPSAAGRPA
jgi:hypothetical protein